MVADYNFSAIELNGRAAANAGCSHSAGNNGGVAGHTSANGQYALGDLHAGDILRAGLEADENDLLLHITARGEPKNDSLAFTILHNGRLKYYRTVDSHDIQVELDSLPNGIAQITLYDRQGRIWADRLFFVLHKGFSSQTVSIEHIKDSYEPYSPVQLKLKGVASGVVSVSVRDKALSPYTNDDGTVLTETLLSSQIKGFVEHPSYYFEKYDETHLRNLDLLMMVQGWRRHGWHELTHPMTISHPVEKSRTLYGEVYRMDIPPKKGFDPHRILPGEKGSHSLMEGLALSR